MVLDALRSFFSNRRWRRARRGPDPVGSPACALLLEIAHADSTFTPEERERIARHAREGLGVAEGDVRKFSASRRRREGERRSLPVHPSGDESFSREQRLPLIEAIWGVVYSDGVLTAVEGQLARRIAELLGFQHPEVQAARERVTARKA